MSSKEVNSLLRSKFVDEFYFPLGGLPEMNVFAGAWGYSNDDIKNAKQTDEFAIAIQKLSELEISPQLNGHAVPKISNDEPFSDSFTPKRKTSQTQCKTKCCAFSRNNGEKEWIYKSHNLRNNRNRVECPRLREYKCTICGAFGDYAHTVRYCPQRLMQTAFLTSATIHQTQQL